MVFSSLFLCLACVGTWLVPNTTCCFNSCFNETFSSLRGKLRTGGSSGLEEDAEMLIPCLSQLCALVGLVAFGEGCLLPSIEQVLLGRAADR